MLKVTVPSPPFKRCEEAGIKVKILTGDSIKTAEAIAVKLDILKEDSKVYEDKYIREMNDSELKKELENIVVIARCTPDTKKG